MVNSHWVIQVTLPARCSRSEAEALNLDEQAPPTRDVVSMDFYGMSVYKPAAQHPGSEPFFDFWREVPNDIALGEVYPDTGRIVDRGTGNHEEWIARVDGGEVTGTFAENGAVHGDAEAGWALRG